VTERAKAIKEKASQATVRTVIDEGKSVNDQAKRVNSQRKSVTAFQWHLDY
jgi:hypothetical protein